MPNQHTISPRPALERFAEKCRFDPLTGCVLWIGGTTSGQGKTQRYGRFHDAGNMWLAHRWAGVHIHGLDLRELQAAHVCPGVPNTLCVQHIAAQTNAENIAEQHARLGNPAHRMTQSALERQYWLLVEKGVERRPEIESTIANDDVPFHTPPAWLAPFLAPIGDPDDCPF